MSKTNIRNIFLIIVVGFFIATTVYWVFYYQIKVESEHRNQQLRNEIERKVKIFLTQVSLNSELALEAETIDKCNGMLLQTRFLDAYNFLDASCKYIDDKISPSIVLEENQIVKFIFDNKPHKNFNVGYRIDLYILKDILHEIYGNNFKITAKIILGYEDILLVGSEEYFVNPVEINFPRFKNTTLAISIHDDFWQSLKVKVMYIAFFIFTMFTLIFWGIICRYNKLQTELKKNFNKEKKHIESNLIQKEKVVETLKLRESVMKESFQEQIMYYNKHHENFKQMVYGFFGNEPELIGKIQNRGMVKSEEENNPVNLLEIIESVERFIKYSAITKNIKIIKKTEFCQSTYLSLTDYQVRKILFSVTYSVIKHLESDSKVELHVQDKKKQIIISIVFKTGFKFSMQDCYLDNKVFCINESEIKSIMASSGNGFKINQKKEDYKIELCLLKNNNKIYYLYNNDNENST